MVMLKPFKGLRPKKDLVQKVASFPYDVINSTEARKIAKNNPMSFLHIVKPEIDLPEDIDLYDDKVYQKACHNLELFIQKGYLVKDMEDKYYIYRQIMGDHVQTGIVACSHVSDYEKGLIKRHEFTRKDKENDRTRHVSDTNINAGPVFLTYRAENKIDALVQKVTARVPEYDFVSDDGFSHIMWLLDDPEEIKTLTGLFEKVPALYVADGHHRAASAARVAAERGKHNPDHNGTEEYNWFLTVLFPHNQLKIFDYNRVVKSLNNNSKEDFLQRVKENFDVIFLKNLFDTSDEKSCPRPEGYNQIIMLLIDQWYLLKPRKGSFDENDPVKSLDVAILQDNLLSPILGIEDPRTSYEIDFVGGIRGIKYLAGLVESGQFQVAFAMYPTSIDQLMAIADSGEVMPPKSTWFEPKLRSGVVVHSLREE
jgi:uncharacterized protein (DUF1015 family)